MIFKRKCGELICSRFILNIPDEEAHSIERIGFQIEQAHWFYEDFVREENPKLPSYSLKNFSFLFFASCPTLKQFYPNREFVYSEFLKYKVRVPVCGAIIVDESLSNILLVRGFKNDASWSWPKGKINQDESEPDCAIRELYEETGFDGSSYLKPHDYIERTIKDKRIRLYILLYVPKNTIFQTRTRKEIGAIEWFPLSAVPGFGKIQDDKKHKFYLVTAFMPRLIQFLKKESKKSNKTISNKLFSGYKTDYKTESESEYIHEKNSKLSIKNIESKRIALLAALKPQKDSDDDVKKGRKKKEVKKSSAVITSVNPIISTPILLKRQPAVKINPLLNFKFDIDRILVAMALKA